MPNGNLLCLKARNRTHFACRAGRLAIVERKLASLMALPLLFAGASAAAAQPAATPPPAPAAVAAPADEIDFSGAVDKEAIEKVFEFVQDDCAIRILPPGSKVIDYLRLIEALPEDRTRLGELLVQGSNDP